MKDWLRPLLVFRTSAIALIVGYAFFLGVLLAACATAKGVAGDFGDVAEDAGLCDIVGVDCGQVFLCGGYDMAGAAWSAELCWVDGSAVELEDALSPDYAIARCQPTPRGGALGWPCVYQCPSARGCNAYEGCWCP